VKTVKVLASIVTAILLLSLAAQADVKVELKKEKISIGQDGKEVTSSAKQAAPGDLLQYTATYKNDKSPVKQVYATLPIPQAEVYVPGTANPAGAMASTDGTHFSPIPLKRTVKNSAGQNVEQEVPASEYRALRWSLGDMAGGESRTVSARVKLRTAPAAR
jgi:hypothetical protein